MPSAEMKPAASAAVLDPHGGPRLADYVGYFSWRRLAKLAYGLVAFVVIAEVGLAVFSHRAEVFDGDLILKDSNLGFRLASNYGPKRQADGTVVATNSWGLREREFGPRADDTLRVLVLGDSIVFGLGVDAEDTFPRKLEEVLQERLGRQVEVVNGGVPGWGTIQALRFFDEAAERLQPAVVILTMSVINDIADNLKFVRPDKRWDTAPTTIYRFFLWLRQRSQIYMMVRRYRFAVTGEQMMQAHATDLAPATERGLGLTLDSFVDLAAAARDRGVQAAFVVAPAQRQVARSEWDEILREHRLDGEAYAFDQPNRRMLEFAAEAGLPLLDVLPALRAAEPLPYENEHWTQGGHALVAREVADFLVERGLLPVQPPAQAAR